MDERGRTVRGTRSPPAGGESVGRDGYRVLSLVTKADATFYRQQIAALERAGVTSKTLALPGTHYRSDTAASSRSVRDYLRFYPTVLRHSFGPYELVHANYGLTGPAALAQPTLKVVLSLWGSDLYGRYGPVSRWCARRADAVIVMSEAMATALGTECDVIPHGVDLDLFRPHSRAEAQSELGWNPATNHVLFPYAKSRPEKDFPRARRLVDLAERRVGTPVELHTMFDVPHDRMALVMNAADALVVTSRHEGSPNAVKEALACNLPVVSTDVGDVSEQLSGVSPGGVGRTDDELVRLLVGVLEADERSNGREAVRPLGLDRMAERIADVYERVLSA